jgi:2-polyprenyl-6-methoxyphenol hydroxylase-like FAD-dependent oxidoreductase
MPQWDFLNFIAGKAALLPNFRLIHHAQVLSLQEEKGQVTGVIANVAGETQTFNADLVVGCDGRNSIVREQAGMEIRRYGAPRDVLWLKINKRPDDPQWSMGHRGPKKNFIMIDRGDYWQCGYSIPKDSLDALKAQGIPPFLDLLAGVSPFERARLAEDILSWDDVRLLVIRIDRLKAWAKPGLLCIGDAAHAMSPIGGVGVNLAIQDAVATANIITEPLKAGRLTLRHLKRIQRRRAFPTWATQSLQIMISRAGQKKRTKPPSRMEAWLRGRKFIPFLFGRLIGVGFYREIPKL